MIEGFHTNIFSFPSENFEELAIEIYRFQYQNCKVYQQFCDLLKRNPKVVHSLEEVPFLPISFFKNHEVLVNKAVPEYTFLSSSTTGIGQSKHLVSSLKLYEKSFSMAFEKFYGPITQYSVLGLLPSYLEREGSSLVYMVHSMIKQSLHSESGFYIDDFEKLHSTILYNESKGQNTLLIGVTYALLDFAERFSMELKHTIVMETGGMKGRKAEMEKRELHSILKERLGVEVIHSEYGMTEMLSQAYSKGDSIFDVPPWLKILIRSVDDPLEIMGYGKRGAINVIDFANIYSCSFLATDDLGIVFPGERFEVLGRMDYSDVRGCSLLYI